jgi:hypothetical protein
MKWQTRKYTTRLVSGFHGPDLSTADVLRDLANNVAPLMLVEERRFLGDWMGRVSGR